MGLRLLRGLSLLLLLAFLPEDTLGAALAKAKTKKSKAKKKPAASSSGGFGAAASKAAPASVLQPPQWKQAVQAKGAMLVATPEQPQLWLEMGALLVKGREYAEAERVFRLGATKHPDFEYLSAAALTLGGDSEAYWHGEAEPHKPGPPADAAAFESFDAPAEVLDRWDQADRAVEWTSRAKDMGVVHRSTAPLLSAEECAWVIDATEAHAATNGGWTTARHVQAPTTDVPVSQVPALREWFDGVLKESIFPTVAALYPEAVGSPNNLRVMDAFVVRYDAAGQASLPVHQDENVLSSTIALNAQADYEGGGVCFEAVRPVGAVPSQPFGATVLNADAGGVVTFPGKLRHGGNTITAGRRYIVPLFLYVDCNHSGKKPGYLLRQLGLPEADPNAAAALSRFSNSAVAA